MKKKVVAMSQGDKQVPNQGGGQNKPFIRPTIDHVDKKYRELLALLEANRKLMNISVGGFAQPSPDRTSASLSSLNNDQPSNSHDITLQPSNFFSRVWAFFSHLTKPSDPSTGLKIEHEGLHFLEEKDYNEGVKNTINDIIIEYF